MNVDAPNNAIRGGRANRGMSSDPVPAGPTAGAAPSNQTARFKLSDALAQHDHMMAPAPVTSVGPTIVPRADQIKPDGSLPNPPDELKRGR